MAAATVRGIGLIVLVDGTLLAAALLIMTTASRVLGFARSDESAIVFCGSQKSVVSGIPIASTLIAGPALGPFVLPIMVYHSMQLLASRITTPSVVARSATASTSISARESSIPAEEQGVCLRPRITSRGGTCARAGNPRSIRHRIDAARG